ncbi:MAG: EFR1 family ferrodoxin [Oscillospiraceae bacterium]|jgi:ferredoxin|nr:EFR1 family ferrodoxin [Oscillospiraceae bacterium]
MANTSCIYWFSGTGNSLCAAKRLSAELNGIPLTQITESAPSGAVGGIGAKIGFVFPSYYGNLPRAVKAFVEKLEIKPDTYIFAVVTMGGVGQGSVGALDKVLKAKGLRLNYGKGVHMPPNYVMNYNPADPGKSAKALDKADEKLRKFAGEIAARMQMVKTLPVTANNLFRNIEQLDAGVTAGDGCTGCGLCERICPVRNIRLESGRPEWLNRCEHCMACISWCPAKAINFSNKTQDRRRYRNPRITVEELTRQENE